MCVRSFSVTLSDDPRPILTLAPTVSPECLFWDSFLTSSGPRSLRTHQPLCRSVRLPCRSVSAQSSTGHKVLPLRYIGLPPLPPLLESRPSPTQPSVGPPRRSRIVPVVGRPSFRSTAGLSFETPEVLPTVTTESGRVHPVRPDRLGPHRTDRLGAGAAVGCVAYVYTCHY